MNIIKLFFLFSVLWMIHSCKKNETVSVTTINWNTYTSVGGLSNFWVNAIAFDSLGNKWFGTGNGELKFQYPNWMVYNSNSDTTSNSKNVVLAIGLDKKGYGWFGTNGGGVFNSTIKLVYNLADTIVWTNYTFLNTLIKVSIKDSITAKDTTVIKAIGLVNDTVRAIVIDTFNNKWFGTSAGLAELSKDSVWSNFGNGRSIGLTCDSISCITIDKQYNKWCGTLGGGIVMFNGTTFVQGYQASTLLGKEIYVSDMDALGNLWFGTGNGVLEYNGSTWKSYTMTNGLVNNSVRAIAIDKKGNIWFGTDAGVSKYNGSTWTTYTTKNGLVANTVLAIAIDDQNNIWFGTTGGISELLSGN